MRLLASLTLSLCVLLMSGQALAFGIGNIDMRSGLDQPIHAYVRLHDVDPENVNEINVGLASPRTYRRLNLQRRPILDHLQFAVVERGESTFIHISSDESIPEPFLNFILAVESSDVRVMREYTVLLDPPNDTQENGEIRFSKGESSDVASRMAASGATGTNREPFQGSQTRNEQVDRSFHLTESGNTTLGLAGKFAPDGVTAHQMAVALLRENPDAFIGGNVHRLRSGRVLDIPPADQAAAISPAEAVAMMDHHVIQKQEAREHTNHTGRDKPELGIEDTTPYDTWRMTNELASTLTSSAERPEELREELKRARQMLDVLRRDNEVMAARLEAMGSKVAAMEDQLFRRSIAPLGEQPDHARGNLHERALESQDHYQTGPQGELGRQYVH